MKEMNEAYLWGIDLGGTKIEGVILRNTPEKEVILRKRIATEGQKGYKHVLSRIKLLVDMLEKESLLKANSIGIGTPGVLDPTSRLMKNSNSTSLNGKPMLDDLLSLLKIPIKMANDANCFAVAETLMGIVPEVMPEVKVVFGVILGTGVGGGLVVNGQVIYGRHGIGGEWGHNFLDNEGGECYCGKKGCVERIISGPALEKYYHSHSGIKKSLSEINQLYINGKDKYADQTIKRLHSNFGKGVSYIINTIDPDAVVLGGGVGNIESLYTEGPKEALKYIFNDEINCQFLRPKLGDSAGVFGAALL